MSSADPLRARTTALLAAPGDPDTLARLVPMIYDELRQMAHRHLQREFAPRTLHTTDLVHEAYLKLVDDAQVTKRGRAYFFGAAARAMRQILVDYARRRNAQKRGAGEAPLSLDESCIAVDTFADDLVDLDQKLEELAALNPRHAQVVECRFFGGLSIEETADVLNVSPRTVKYDWALARAWLYDALHGPS